MKLLRLPLIALLICFMFLASTSTAEAGILKRFRERHSGCSASSGGTSHAGRPIANLFAGGPPAYATCK